MSIFETPKSQLLKQALDVYSRQHNAIAKNVANVNNPEYQRVQTDFSSELHKAEERTGVKTSHPQHIQGSQFERKRGLTADESKQTDVDLTQEMADLAENQIRYEFSARTLNRYYSGLSTAILGRSR